MIDTLYDPSHDCFTATVEGSIVQTTEQKTEGTLSVTIGTDAGRRVVMIRIFDAALTSRTAWLFSDVRRLLPEALCSAVDDFVFARTIRPCDLGALA